MEDALDCLDRKKYSNSAISFVQDKEEIFYMRRIFNHDYYDSLIFSGRLDEIASDLIQPLQDIYISIKGHNTYLTRAMNVEDVSDVDIPGAAVSYFKWMDKHEKKLLKEIPKMIKKLQQ